MRKLLMLCMITGGIGYVMGKCCRRMVDSIARLVGGSKRIV